MSIEVTHGEPSYPPAEGFHNFEVVEVTTRGNAIDVWWSCIDCGARRYRSIRIPTGKCAEVTA